ICCKLGAAVGQLTTGFPKNSRQPTSPDRCNEPAQSHHAAPSASRRTSNRLRSPSTGNMKINTHTRTVITCSVVACSLLIASRPAVGGPPFLTDDPEPVEYQHHEFYIASQQTKTADGRDVTLPHFEYNYGAAPDLQLHIIVPYAVSSPAHDPRHSGLGDIEFGAKYRFLQETDSRPMMGIFPMFVPHSGDADKGLATVPLRYSCLCGCRRNGVIGKVTAAAAIG